MPKPLRKKQIEQTRKALLKAGCKLFGDKGFTGVSAQEIVARAGVTRGALYHHFSTGKPGLFEAVARGLQEKLVEAMAIAGRSEDDSWASMKAVLKAYFDFASDKSYRKITLQDAPSVLGAEHWRVIEYEYSLKFIQIGFERMIARGEIQSSNGRMLATVIFGACCEATLAIASSDQDAEFAKEEAIDVIMSLLEGLRGS